MTSGRLALSAVALIAIIESACTSPRQPTPEQMEMQKQLMSSILAQRGLGSLPMQAQPKIPPPSTYMTESELAKQFDAWLCLLDRGAYAMIARGSSWMYWPSRYKWTWSASSPLKNLKSRSRSLPAITAPSVG